MIRVSKRLLPPVVLALALSACATGPSAQSSAPPASQAASASPRSSSPIAATRTAAPDATASAGTTAAPAATPTAGDAVVPAVTSFDAARVALAVQPSAEGFEEPLFVTHAGDSSNRMFVVEKGGVIRLLDGTVFMDISDRIRSNGYEQGLLGLAFHPQFAQNSRFFVHYSDQDGNTVISRFSAVDNNQQGDPASEQVILQQEQPAANHNGGMIAFGPDGYLYIGLGDGGGANDQFGNGQNLQTWLATLLRIDVDGGEPYAVPQNNPFVGRNDARPEIWAYGLRNPWRFSFDRATGDLWIGDVGQNQWEEINMQPAASGGGENYGWPVREAAHCFRDNSCSTDGLVDPVAEYSHDEGISVTGGYVYRGTAFPALQGAYIFADYGTGRIWATAPAANGGWTTTEMAQLDAQISSFGENEAGELFLTDIGGGRVHQVTAQAR